MSAAKAETAGSRGRSPRKGPPEGARGAAYSLLVVSEEAGLELGHRGGAQQTGPQRRGGNGPTSPSCERRSLGFTKRRLTVTLHQGRDPTCSTTTRRPPGAQAAHINHRFPDEAPAMRAAEP